MRRIDERAIKAHADLRFRSEYDYALFEYYRSAKVIAFLERAGRRGAAAACSTPAAAAAACRCRSRKRPALVVGIDPAERFQDAGVRLGRERGVRQPARSRWPTACPCRSATRTFDLVLSHAVIEHVADAPLYLRECARVLAPGGHVYLSTAPYLSFAGAHLPRLKVPLPLHLMVGPARRVRDVPVPRPARGLDAEGAGERELVHQGGAARRGQGRRPAREGPRRAAARPDRRRRPARSCARSCTSTATVRRLPAPLARWLRDSPLTQDALISNMEYVLTRAVD